MRRPSTVAFALLAALALLSLSARPSSAATESRWMVSGQQILVNGEAFFGKGVVYGPTPIGGSADYVPFQDWFDSEKGRDLIWKRDLPRLQAMGTNLVRLNGWWKHYPTTGVEGSWSVNNIQKNVEGKLDWSVSTKADLGSGDHTAFLDALWNGGEKPIYALVGIAIDKGNTWTNVNPGKYASKEAYYDFYFKTAKWAAQKYGSHPAVLGFVLGNEMNDHQVLADDTWFWPKLNEMAAAVKAAAPNKLVTVAWQNDSGIYGYKGFNSNKAFDFWGFNVYNGKTFGIFWTEYGNYVTQYGGKPVLLTEWGTPTGKHTPTDVPGPYDAVVTEDEATNIAVAKYLASLWTDMTSETGRKICSGGTVFEWSDEWWKTPPKDFEAGRDPGGSDKPRTWLHDASKGPGPGGPNPWWEEEWFGLHSIAVTGNRNPRNPTDDRGYIVNVDALTEREGYRALKGLWTKGVYEKPELSVRTAQRNLAFPIGTALHARIANCEAPLLARQPDYQNPLLAGRHLDGTQTSFIGYRLNLNLEAGSSLGTPVEWFLIHVKPSGMRQWDPYNAGWVTVDKVTPMFKGPLEDLVDVTIPVGFLESGAHTFTFAVDQEVNGTNDNDHWFSSTNVIVVH